eukprot:4821030-Pyramimonas_sp.AAC.1
MPSPIDGCLRSIEPSKLVWAKSLSDARILVACLLDELSANGFRGVGRLFHAEGGAPRVRRRE